jgi:hypothetical protein
MPPAGAGVPSVDAAVADDVGAAEALGLADAGAPVGDLVGVAFDVHPPMTSATATATPTR